MLADIQALETQIRANPDDTDAWDVFGDWLAENGDCRGELIRLERLATQVQDPALTARIAALVAEHQQDWELESAPSGTTYGWRHGFISEITMTDVRSASEIDWLVQIFSNPKARFVTGIQLRFHSSVGVKLIKRLARLEFTRLRRFQAAYHGFGDTVTAALARQPTRALTGLDLRYTGLTNMGLKRLIRDCPDLRLRALYLQYNQIGAEGVEALAGSEICSALDTLDLRRNPLGAKGAAALANSPHLGALTTLRLHPDDIGRDGMRALASSSVLSYPINRYWRARGNAR